MSKHIVLEQEDTEDEPSDQHSKSWYPYNSKLMFLLDVIDNLPRLRISRSLMKVFLWLLKQVGVKCVPSFDALRKVQSRIRDESGVPTINWMSPKGNAFSFNDPKKLIANVSLCFSNDKNLPEHITGLDEPTRRPAYPTISCYSSQRGDL